MSRYTLFIANRLYRDKERREPVSRLATNLATFGIGIGLAVMIVSVCIVLGFKWEISSKVIGFGSDIEILNAQSFSSTESVPIDCSEAVVNEIRHTQGVRSIQRTSRKFGIIKTETDYKGIMFKGIGPEYNAQFIKKNLVEGRFPEYAKEKGQNSIIVSRSVARKMNLKLNDRLFSYFFENSIKVRRFTIVGIFETSMQQFDENVIYTNIYAINQLNKWDDDRCSSLELSVENSEQLDETYTNVLNTIHNLKSADGSEYVVYTVKQLYSQIFDWLKLLDLNIWVIIALMTILSSLTIISGLLILILEKLLCYFHYRQGSAAGLCHRAWTGVHTIPMAYCHSRFFQILCQFCAHYLQLAADYPAGGRHADYLCTDTRRSQLSGFQNQSCQIHQI